MGMGADALERVKSVKTGKGGTSGHLYQLRIAII